MATVEKEKDVWSEERRRGALLFTDIPMEV